MSSEQVQVTVWVRAHVRRAVMDLGLQGLLPDETIDEGLDELMLGLGQLLADVERAHRRRAPLGDAVHAHEDYPYLGKFHGFVNDALTAPVPPDVVPLMRQLARKPPPAWLPSLVDALSVVARSAAARPEERAFARLTLFELLRMKLGYVAYRTEGSYEGTGGSRRELDTIASDELEAMLAVPLTEDATEPYHPWEAALAAAMVSLTQRVEARRELASVIDGLAETMHARKQLELQLREADPVDATILRDWIAEDAQDQPIPVKRLPLEHPLLLAGYREDALHQRRSRAVRQLEALGPTALRREQKTITLAEMLVELEAAHA